MATKDYYVTHSKDRQNLSDINKQIINFNLNQSNNSNKFVVLPKYDLIGENNNSASLKYIEKNNSINDSNIWSWNSKELFLKNEFDKRNHNTLSPNFDALANAINMTGIQSDKSKLFLKNIKRIIVKQPSTLFDKNMFEMPRQQKGAESNINEPEIMQFKSSQKLFDLNQSTPKKKSQLSPNPSVSTPKRGTTVDQKDNEVSGFSQSMNQSIVSNPFYSMPSQMDLNKILQTPPTTKPILNFEWSLEQQARVRPALFDSDFNYASPMNSEFDLKNDTFWSNEIIAPSPIRQPRNFDIISVASSSTQTDISIPIDFNFAAILPSFKNVSNHSLSFDLSSSSDQYSGQNDISDGFDIGEEQKYDLDGGELPQNFLDDLEISPIGSAYGDNE